MMIGTMQSTLIMDALAYKDLPTMLTLYNFDSIPSIQCMFQWLHAVQVMRLLRATYLYVRC